MKFERFITFIFVAFLLATSSSSIAKKKEKGIVPAIDTSVFSNLKYRNIGPFRGGRSAAVCGVAENPDCYYFGSVGGGVWKTEDAGQNWKNITDGYFGGSIGAVTVAPSDANIIYVGGGEKTVRGNVSYGYGIWKSVDAGETWKYKGLKEGQNIPRIRVHPKNPDIVYAAVLGHVFGSNKERGIYRSTNGGDSWEHVLFVNENAGAVDIIIDPFNPRVIYASTWRMKRTPYSLESGGAGSALWKSSDGGTTWQNISENSGLPKGMLGIIGVTASPVKRNRLWAVVENKNGGIFRSDDAGKTWRKTNSDRNLRQRAWYYSRIYADSKNPDQVYVLNVQFWVSKDGGKSFNSINSTPHSDHHDLWINPENPDYMVIGDDGGAQVSMDGARNFSSYMNQPTAQFYRVTTDNHFPYRIYAAQQDNSTVRIPHRSLSGGITEDDWESTAGGESGHIAPDPNNPDIVYGGSYGGHLTRINHKTGERRLINVWPDNPMGWGAKDLKYRFQWNFPVFFSKHNSKILYTAAQVLFKTSNEGQSWEQISPDLTRNDTTKMESSGGPITKDNTSVEYYGTIFSACESAQEPGVIWAGSDDGLIHVTRDGGKHWENVTPPVSMMPQWTMINSLEPHPTEKGGVYVAATSYKNDDFTPYLYKTTDYGHSWIKITDGIPETHFTRVIRADKNRAGLLYAGTESGMYISFNDGGFWQPFQLNLPIVPITDLTLKKNDLIVATQGRALWILDDLTTLHQLSNNNIQKDFILFDQRDSYRIGGGRSRNTGVSGQNPPGGVAINFYLKNVTDSSKVQIEILEENGTIIKTVKTNTKEKDLKENLALGKLEINKGVNQFVWDLQYPGAKGFPGLIMWGGSLRGPVVVPGTYKVRLSVENKTEEKSFRLLANPNFSATQADYQAQFDLLIAIRDKVSETHETIIAIRAAKKQIDGFIAKLDKKADKTIVDFSKELTTKMDEIEKTLYQTKNQSRQDPLNFPIKLNNKLAAVGGEVASSNFRPTDQEYKVKAELTRLIDIQLNKFKQIKEKEIPQLNKMIWDAKIPAIQLK